LSRCTPSRLWTAPWFWGPLSISASSRRADSSPMVGLNRGQVSDPAAPFGGSKQSGIGREGGHDGMLDYLESKYIAKQG
jgi:succinate-semialdehyde dehydrogenase / glutarate-semialdehyde dehydrogenase